MHVLVIIALHELDHVEGGAEDVDPDGPGPLPPQSPGPDHKDPETEDPNPQGPGRGLFNHCLMGLEDLCRSISILGSTTDRDTYWDQRDRHENWLKGLRNAIAASAAMGCPDAVGINGQPLTPEELSAIYGPCVLESLPSEPAGCV